MITQGAIQGAYRRACYGELVPTGLPVAWFGAGVFAHRLAASLRPEMLAQVSVIFDDNASADTAPIAGIPVRLPDADSTPAAIVLATDTHAAALGERVRTIWGERFPVIALFAPPIGSWIDPGDAPGGFVRTHPERWRESLGLAQLELERAGGAVSASQRWMLAHANIGATEIRRSELVATTRTSAVEPLTGAGDLRILVNSWPKAGTHLLLELVRSILGDGAWMSDRDVKSPQGDAGFLDGVDDRITAHGAGFAIKGHFPWSPEIESGLVGRGFRTLLIVRDLRDVACSTLRWMRDLSPDWQASKTLLSLPTNEQRLASVITGLSNEHPFDRDSGIDWSAPLPVRYARLTDWAGRLRPDAIVRYEDLLGAKGESAQRGVITRVCRTLGLRTDASTIDRLAGSVFNPGAVTFHTGSSGGWADEFTREHRRLFVEAGGDAVNARFGYTPTELRS
jgi:hypothetical protein